MSDNTFAGVRPGNLNNVDVVTYATFVGLIVSEQIADDVDTFGRLATMLDERPLGDVGERLADVKTALTALLDSVVQVGVDSGVVGDEFISEYESIKAGR